MLLLLLDNSIYLGLKDFGDVKKINKIKINETISSFATQTKITNKIQKGCM